MTIKGAIEMIAVSSSLEKFISELPKDLQCQTLKAIKEVHERFRRGEFTPEERIILEYGKKLGEKAAGKREEIALKAFNDHQAKP